MKLLITGSYGQLGNELRRLLETGSAEIGPIPAEYAGAEVDYVDYDVLDIRDTQAVNERVARGAYDVIINCAAVTNVDGCELDEDGAYAVNALGAENLARAAANIGAKIVHISTDYVFPGNVEGNRVETDEPNPVSAYGRTKLAGERLVAAANPRHFIIRTAWLYGYVGKNFAKTMRNLGQTREQVEVVCDQLGNPTSANDLAYIILQLALTNNYGIYHVTNNGTCAWSDFAAAVMQGCDLPCEVVPITSAEYKEKNPASASRPAFSSLRNKHLEETIGDSMRDWQVALAEYLEKLPQLEG